MADRVQREIEEILRLNAVPTNQGVMLPSISSVRPPSTSAFNSRWRSVAAVPLGRLMTWSLLIVIAAFLLRAIPGASWVMLGALIVFLVTLLVRLAAPPDTTTEPGWLSQPIEDWAPGWLHSVKGWIQALKEM